jgi:hypothetical protein
MTDVTNTAAPPVDVEKLIGKYVKLRDIIKQKNDEHSAAMKPYGDAMAGVENILLSVLDANSLTNMKTAAGTASILDKWSAVVDDPVTFRTFCIEQNQLDLADVRANVTAVKDYNEANGALPPGVRLTSFRKVGVRRAGKTE